MPWSQGNRDVLSAMDQGSQRVMESVLKVIDEYDLYGQVSCGACMGERGGAPVKLVWRPVRKLHSL